MTTDHLPPAITPEMADRIVREAGAGLSVNLIWANWAVPTPPIDQIAAVYNANAARIAELRRERAAKAREVPA